MIKILDLTKISILSLNIEDYENDEEKVIKEKRILNLLEEKREIILPRIKNIIYGKKEKKYINYYLSKFKYEFEKNQDLNLSNAQINSLAILILYVVYKSLIKKDIFILNTLTNKETKSIFSINKIIYEYLI